MLKFKIKTGADNGNSAQKISFGGNVVTASNIVSSTKEFKGLDEEERALNIESIIDNIHDNLCVEIISDLGSQKYYVGTLAQKIGNFNTNMEIGADNDKASEEIPVITTLSRIAAETLKKNKIEILEADPRENIKINVDMTTALPITQYNTENIKKFISKFMDKEHEVVLYITQDVKFKFIILFEFVKIIPEGVDAVFALQKDSKYKDDFIEYSGNHQFDGFEHKKLLHIPIGEGSTDLAYTEHITFYKDRNVGINVGVGHAIEKCLTEFVQKVNLRKTTRQSLSAILRDDKHKYHSVASDLIEQYLISEADQIIRNAKTQIETLENDIDIIVVYGGGSVLMRMYLEDKLKKLCNQTKIQLYYVSERYAVEIEAEGLYQFTNSDIFRLLKANSNKK